MTPEIKTKKKMQSFQISEAQIKKLSELKASINQNGTNHSPISKNALIGQALDLLFKKYKI